MSELIERSSAKQNIRWELLCTGSALVLLAHVAANSAVAAEDSDRPTVWIDVGGQFEFVQGTSRYFTSPFMSALSPTPAPYRDNIFIEAQNISRSAFGFGGKISFQPEGADWTFSAAIRYGRANAKKHIHHQTDVPPATRSVYLGYPIYADYHLSMKPTADTVADVVTPYRESHAVIDFQVGRDVGLGLLGRSGTFNLNAGVRFAQLQTKSSVAIDAIPKIDADLIYAHLKYGTALPNLRPDFQEYSLRANAVRSFRGVGPSLSWNASTTIIGSTDSSALTFDFGANAAVLFGRQKAKADHTTQSYHSFYTASGKYINQHHDILSPNSIHSTRSRSGIVPNVGGFAALSVKYPNAKVSVGYRGDFFFGATDTGIDKRDVTMLGFHGPFAAISVGLGG